MFNFSNYKKTNKKENYTIKISGEECKEDRIFKGIHESLEISNKFGKLFMEPFTFPPNLSAKDILTIEKYSFKLNQDFIDYNISGAFSSWMIIELYSITKEEFTSELIDYIKTYYEIQSIDFSENKLIIEMKIGNFSLEDYIDSKRFQNSNKQNLNKNENLEDLTKFNKMYINSARKFKDEFGNLKISEGLKFDESLKSDLKEENYSNYNKGNLQRNQTNNFFDFSDENFFDFEEEKNFERNYAENTSNPYSFPNKEAKNDSKKIRKSQYMYGLRPNFNQFGEFITIGKFNDNKKSFSLNLNKIVPNKNLVNNNSNNNKLSNNQNENLYESYPRSLYKELENSCGKNKMEKSVNIFLESNVINHDYFAQTIADFCNILNLNKAKKSNLYQGAIQNKNLNENFNEANSSMNLDENFQEYNKKNTSANVNKNLLEKDLKDYIEKNSIDKNLKVIDYTNFLNEYIYKLEKIREKFINFHKLSSNSNSEVLTNINKELSALRLFISLYLNPSKSQDLKMQDSSEKKKELINKFSNSNCLITQRLRKKRLFDWLINEEENSKIAENQIKNFHKNYECNLNSEENQTNLYKFIFMLLINGDINHAMEISSQYKLLNISTLISQISSQTKDSKNIKFFQKEFFEFVKESQNKYLNFIYELLFPKTKEVKENANFFNLTKDQRREVELNSGKFYYANFYPNISNEIKPEITYPTIISELNWKQFLICIGLYSKNSTSRLDDIVEEYSAMNIYFNKFPQLKSERKNDINILQLQYYTFVNNRKDIDINQINNLFSQTNIFSKFSDYHLHFILCYILLNNLKESYSHLKEHLAYLKKIQFFLLKKILEDLLITGYIPQAINLVVISNLDDPNKCAIIEEIIQKFTSIDNMNSNNKLPLVKIFEKISPKITYNCLAFKYLSFFNIEKTIEYLKYSENHEKLNEVKLIFY